MAAGKKENQNADHMIRPVAYIHTDFPTKFGIPRQSGLTGDLEAKIVFEPEFSNPAAIRGIEEFSDQTKEYGLAVEIPEEFLEFLPEEKRDPLRAVLAQDPRPSYQEDPDRVYGMEFAGYEVKFTVSEKVLHVKSVEKCTV